MSHRNKKCMNFSFPPDCRQNKCCGNKCAYGVGLQEKNVPRYDLAATTDKPVSVLRRAHLPNTQRSSQFQAKCTTNCGQEMGWCAADHECRNLPGDCTLCINAGTTGSQCSPAIGRICTACGEGCSLFNPCPENCKCNFSDPFNPFCCAESDHGIYRYGCNPTYSKC